MPTPSKKPPRRGASASPSPHRRSGKNVVVRGDSNSNNTTALGRRRTTTTNNNSTMLRVPPRGEIPLDEDGLEDADAFFAAARSPSSLTSSGGKGRATGSSPGRAYGKRAERIAREQRSRSEERRRLQREREELEEEGRRNVERVPDVLKARDDDDDDDNNSQSQHSNSNSSYRPTPRRPGWTDRALHRAMGVLPAEDEDNEEESSPGASTVLSRVSTAAPSTNRRSSMDTIATEARHGLRARQLDELTEAMVAVGGQESNNSLDVASSSKKKEASARAGTDAPEEEEHAEEGAAGRAPEEVEGEEEEFGGGPMDPPEETSEDRHHGSGREGRRGALDPVERDHLLEPEEKDDEEEEEEENVVVLSAKGSSRSAASSSSDVDVSVRPSARSAGSVATDPLEDSLEEVVNNNSQGYDDGDFDDDDEGGDGGMRLATQRSDDDDNDDVSFGGGNDGGDFGDDAGEIDDGDAVSHQASQVSEKSRKSNHSRESETSHESQASSRDSGKGRKDQPSRRPPSPYSDDDGEGGPYFVDEEEPIRKAEPKEARKRPPPAASTPTSVLRTKKSKKKKKQQTSNRVNWSTPNGVSTGRPAGNRDYEAVPVSDYKEEYPPGEEPQTPGGSSLRRSRRARFKPLQFWKNEKLIYEAQNERGMLGEAMGDMPVVAGVMHALPTPHKEVRRRKEPLPKKKKKRRGDDDEDDDDDRDSKRPPSPFDDAPLRKRHRIRDGESGSVWSETLESTTDFKIVSRLDDRSFSKLPLSSTRRKRESKVVGFASQAFHVPTDDDDLFPGYIAGNVVLPPRGIKDAEGVGLCSQVFNVGDCQPGSVEFAIADPSGQDGEFDPRTAQRFLLGKGDMFQIPPGNVYRIENHSRTEKANLFWTIIKCTSRAEQEDSDDDDVETDV